MDKFAITNEDLDDINLERAGLKLPPIPPLRDNVEPVDPFAVAIEEVLDKHFPEVK